MRLLPVGRRCRVRVDAVALLVALATLAHGAPPPTAKPATPRSAPPTALEVTVQDPRGKPVAGALVTIGGGGGVVPMRRSGRTDENGHVRIDALPRPPWEVSVLARGLAPRQLSRITDATPLVVRLEAGGVLSGVVRDSVSRDPVGGARVWVMTRAMGIPTDRWDPDADRIETTADASGRFHLEGLGAAPLDVNAAALGHGYGTQRAVKPGSTIELFLLPGATITGTVRDEAGKPVAGAVVRALGELAARVVPAALRTNAAGRFHFAGLEAGSYTVVARGGPRAPALARVSVEAQGEADIELTLAEGGFVTGRLVDGDEKPRKGRVRVSALDGAELHLAIYDLMQAEAAADGHFALGPVPVGSLEIEAFAAGFATRKVETIVDARSRTTDLGDVALETGLRVRGVVRSRDGAPIAGATVMGRSPASAAARPPVVVTEDDGVFVFAGLQPGNLQLQAHAPGYAAVRQDVAAGNEDVQLVLETGGTIVGSVVDPKGQPVEGAMLTAQSEPAEGEQQAYGGAAADEGGGRFTMRDLRAGRYVLQARARGHADGTASASVVAGRTTDVGAVRLRSGAVVRGTVVDAAGEPIPAATLAVEAAVTLRDSVAQSDGAGRFEVTGLPPGRWTLSARHPAFTSGRAVAEIAGEGEAEVRIVLHRGGRVEGVVRRRDGRPFSNAAVTVRDPVSAGTDWNLANTRTTTAEDGSFALEHVAAGPLQVHVLAPVRQRGFAMLTTVLQRPIEVREGETTRVEIATREVIVSGRVTRGGAPAPGVALSLQRRDGETFSYGAPPGAGPASQGPPPLADTTGEDGSYELLVFEPGLYLPLRRSADGNSAPLRPAASNPERPVSAVEIPDVATHTLDFTVGGATVAGVVLDAEKETPIGHARVIFSGRTGSRGSDTTGPDGRFRFEVEPAEGRLRTSAEEYVPGDEPLAVGEAGTGELRIELRKGLAISGRVEDAAGRSLGEVPIQALREAAERVEPGGFRFSRSDGRFRLSGLPDGAHTLIAGSEALGFGVRRGVAAGASDVVLALRPAIRLAVRVVDESGGPVAMLHVRLANAGGSEFDCPRGHRGAPTPTAPRSCSCPRDPA